MINNNDGVLEWGCFYQYLFACDFTSSVLPWLQQLQRNPGKVLQIPPKLSAENKVVFDQVWLYYCVMKVLTLCTGAA